jgi:hypothetical protein
MIFLQKIPPAYAEASAGTQDERLKLKCLCNGKNKLLQRSQLGYDIISIMANTPDVAVHALN